METGVEELTGAVVGIEAEPNRLLLLDDEEYEEEEAAEAASEAEPAETGGAGCARYAIKVCTRRSRVLRSGWGARRHVRL